MQQQKTPTPSPITPLQESASQCNGSCGVRMNDNSSMPVAEIKNTFVLPLCVCFHVLCGAVSRDMYTCRSANPLFYFLSCLFLISGVFSVFFLVPPPIAFLVAKSRAVLFQHKFELALALGHFIVAIGWRRRLP